MKKATILLIALMVISVGFLSGCNEKKETEDFNDNSIPSGQELSTIEPSNMILQLSDLPSNYTIKERTERVKSDVSEIAISLGWIKGYYVRFARVVNIYDTTVIEQFISIYPIENISKILTSIPRVSNETIIFDELSKPNIGDDSQAYRVTAKDEYGTETKYYMIEFIKMDVYEGLYMSGTTTDYEMLKDLAKIAVGKIK